MHWLFSCSDIALTVPQDLASDDTRKAAKLVIEGRMQAQVQVQQSQQEVDSTRQAVMHINAIEKLDRARLESVRTRNVLAFQHANEAREKARSWLGVLRLMEHEQDFFRVLGVDMAVEDLRFVRQEDIDAIAANMSYVEEQRLNEAITKIKSSAVSMASVDNDE